MINYSEQEEALAKVRKNISLAIKRLEIDRFVVLEEIERELRQVETAFQSFLLLGILRRIMTKDDDKSAKLFVSAITEWKNYFPRKDLGGLSPFEYRQKYPPGVYETGFITELMNEYQARIQPLDEKNRKGEEFDLEKDFSLFQEEFLERLPAEQPFPQQSGKFMNFKDIIIEERRRNGHPEKNIDKIGAQIFVENTPDGAGWQMAEIEDNYHAMVNELNVLKTRRDQRNGEQRVKKIGLFFEEVEPYFRCGPEPHRFYLNYASILLLEDNADQALEMLDKALVYEPDYELAQVMKSRVVDYMSE